MPKGSTTGTGPVGIGLGIKLLATAAIGAVAYHYLRKKKGTTGGLTERARNFRAAWSRSG